MTQQALVDIGNSRLKWRLSSNDPAIQPGLATQQTHSFSTVDFNQEVAQSLAQQWFALDVDTVCLASVASSEVELVIEEAWSGKFNKPLFRPHVNQSSILFSHYQDSQSLGIDRWLSSLGAAAVTSQPVNLVVNAGTATTIDLVVKSGLEPQPPNVHAPWQHLGGSIFPGVQTMLDSLAARGARLPQVTQLKSEAWPKSTIQAIGHGVVASQVGAICRHLEQCRIQYPNQQTKIWLSGGWADELHEALSTMADISVERVEGLVLQGLSLAYEESVNARR